MVYVLAGSEDRDNNLQNAQRRALADPRVVRLAQRFIPLRLSRSADRDVLGDFGLPETANMMMSFVTPDGKHLGDLSGGGISQASSLAAKLLLVYRTYTQQMFEKDLKPKLEDPETRPEELKRTLGIIVEFGIGPADATIAKLLERRLDAALHDAACNALAALSTKTAIQTLLELSRGGDARATRALESCTPVGAELLLEELKPDAEPFDYVVYKAITKACGIRNVWPERRFERARPREKEQEVERVSGLVREAAARWKEANE